MIIKTGPIMECKKCRTEFNLEPTDFDIPNIYNKERNMGYETQYVWTFEHICEKCLNPINLTLEGWEYPKGIFNYEEFTSTGGRIIKNPILEINNEDD